MSDLVKIKKLLREVVGANSNLPVSGTVTEVAEESCTVKLNSGLEVSDVRLKATINEAENYLLLKPKVGSKVLMLSSNGDVSNLSIIKTDEIEIMQYKQGPLEIVCDSTDGKISVKTDDVSLLDILDSLTDIIKTLKVMTNTGPSGTPLPDTINKLEEFKTDYKTLIK